MNTNVDSPMNQSLNELTLQIGETRDLIEVLATRIDSLLNPERNDNEESTGSPVPASQRSFLAQHVLDEAGRVQNTNGRLREILDRIEL